MYKKIAVLLLLLMLVVSGCGDDSVSETPPEAAEPAPVEEAVAEVEEEAQAPEPVAEEVYSTDYLVGDRLIAGDYEITLNSARYDGGNDYIKPDEGMKWLVLDCTITNHGQEQEVVSSMLMFELIGSDFYDKDLTFLPDSNGNLDGDLPPDRTMRGEIGFSVGLDETEWEFIFTPELFGSEQIIFDVFDTDIQ